MTAIFVKSVRTANNPDIPIQDTRRHSVCCSCTPIWRRNPLEKRPLIDLFFCTNSHVCIRNLCNQFGSMFSQCSWFPVVINYTCSVAEVTSNLSSLHTLEPNIQVHQLYTNNKHNTYMDPTLGGSGWKGKRMCKAMITSSLPSLVSINQSVL